MPHKNTSSAYDFSRFEPKVAAPAQPTQKEQPKQESNIVAIPEEHLRKTTKFRRRLKTRGAAKKVILIGVGAAICTVLIAGQVRTSELTDKIDTAQQSLTEAESLYTQYQMKNDSQFSLTTIEEYASKNLGMTKADQTQMEYIELSSKDKGEVMQVKEQNWLVSAWNYVVNLLS